MQLLAIEQVIIGVCKLCSVLGAQLLVVEYMEVINLVALAMRHNITASQLRDEIYTHPSITEGLNEVLAVAQPVA